MIYLDNAASTKARKEVAEIIMDVLLNDYANPDAIHEFGLKISKEIKKSREVTADSLNINPKEIYFTSGGSEGNNILIQGIINANSRKKKHLITTKIEHPSVYEIFREYEERGFEVTYLNVDSYGRVKIEELAQSIREETILVSIIGVNSEVGTIQKLEEIGKLIKEKNSNTIFHTDFVQGYGHFLINLKKSRIDALTVSGHKIHGPKGIGAIYLSDKIKIKPIIFGSNQESGVVQRTLNSSGIIGFGKAVEIMKENFERENNHIKELKEFFIERINKEIEDIRLNSLLSEDFTPHIINVSFRGVKGEVLVHFLGINKIFASTGSACSSKKGNSRILENMGLSEEEVDGGIRFSFSIYNTKEEIVETIRVLKESVNMIRMMK